MQVRKRVSLGLVGFLVVLFGTLGVVRLHTFFHRHVHNVKHRILQELPSVPGLKIHLKAKRPSMAMHGALEFDVVAVAKVKEGSRVSFSGAATFEQDGVTYKYSLVDDYAYLSTQGSKADATVCLDPSTLPPIHEIIGAIDDATVVDTIESSQPLEHACDKKLRGEFAGEEYALCMSSGATGGFSIVGTNLEIDVSYLDEPVEIEKPEVSEELLASCRPVPDSALVTPNALHLLTGSKADWNDALHRRDRKLRLGNPTCGCRGEMKHCIFFHGMGEKPEGGVMDTTTYWGPMHDYMPCCKTIKYASFNTINYGWTDPVLQDKVCKAALSVSPTSHETVIEDTIMLGHSMGNLMISGSIASGRCSMAPSSHYVALSGPMKGSMCVDFQRSVCGLKGSGIPEDVMVSLLTYIGQCPSSPANIDMSYMYESYADDRLNRLYEEGMQVHLNASAVICGVSHVGLPSKDSINMGVLGTFMPHHSQDNDGEVEWDSCIGRHETAKFGRRHIDKFYRADINHMDTKFTHGEAWFGDDKKPLKWLECLF